jgi:hypothetical protein
MKLFVTWGIFAAVCAGGNWARAQLQIISGDKPHCLFAGSTQLIPVLCRNAGSVMIESNIRMRMMQLSSATAAPIDEAPWKTLRVLPGQTVVETAALEFPAVRGETRFLVQWLGQTNDILGVTEVMVYPTNLLSELRPLVGKEGELGVFDPQNELKDLLINAKVDFVDLGNTELEKFRGRLAIVGPFDPKTSTGSVMTAQIKAIAENGVGVVWVQPPADDSPAAREKLRPSFYALPENQTAVVMVQPEMLANLAGNPRSQLNLVYFCKLALHPQPLALPSVKKAFSN